MANIEISALVSSWLPLWKVSGLENDASCFEGRAIYSEMEQTGFLHRNEKINRLFNSLRVQIQFLDMFTYPPTDTMSDDKMPRCSAPQAPYGHPCILPQVLKALRLTRCGTMAV